MTPDRPKILLVDEPLAVSAIARVLEPAYPVTTSTDALAALDLVVISDLEMPVLDGAAFLARLRSASPDTVRILLTGVGDLGAGQIFRFLTKPCLPDVIRRPRLDHVVRSMQQRLYFLPDPHGQGSLRPTRAVVARACAAWAVARRSFAKL
jgi:CheY-like chemotaxis protein